MGLTVFGLFVLFTVVTLGNCQITTYFLEDEYTSFLTNDLIGKTLTVPKFTFDILQSCHVVMPNGAMIELYPTNELNDPYISFLTAAKPFLSCGIGFRGAPTSHSGTYELYSVIEDWSGLGISLTRKRFHLTLLEIQP